MDKELDEQINDVINKATKDLKLKIMRVVTRHQNKLLKEQARALKINGVSSHKPLRVKSKDAVNKDHVNKEFFISKKKSTNRYHNNSESDYYSD